LNFVVSKAVIANWFLAMYGISSPLSTVPQIEIEVVFQFSISER
jgi:hypothetical protein